MSYIPLLCMLIARCLDNPFRRHTSLSQSGINKKQFVHRFIIISDINVVVITHALYVCNHCVDSERDLFCT